MEVERVSILFTIEGSKFQSTLWLKVPPSKLTCVFNEVFKKQSFRTHEIKVKQTIQLQFQSE